MILASYILYKEKMKGICFDLDGTLIDSMGLWNRVDIEYIESKGLVYDDELRKKIKNAPLSDAQGIFSEHFNNEINFDDMYEFLDKTMYEHYSKILPFKPFVEEKLKALKEEKDFIMAITTSTPSKNVDALVERLGLKEYMDYIFTPDSFGIAKNDLKFFEKVLEEMGLKAEEVYVFDDAYYALENAKKLGMVPIGVHDYSGETRGDEIQEIAKFSLENFGQLDIDRL